MKKQDYEKPAMEVCELDMAQPILAGSGNGAVGGEESGDNEYGGGA